MEVYFFFLLFSFPITVSLILDFQKLPYPTKVTIIVNFDSTERRQFYSKALIQSLLETNVAQVIGIVLVANSSRIQEKICKFF